MNNLKLTGWSLLWSIVLWATLYFGVAVWQVLTTAPSNLNCATGTDFITWLNGYTEPCASATQYLSSRLIDLVNSGLVVSVIAVLILAAVIFLISKGVKAINRKSTQG